MNKLVKLFTIFISAITLTLASISSTFAKEEEILANVKVIAEINVINNFNNLFISSPLLIN